MLAAYKPPKLMLFLLQQPEQTKQSDKSADSGCSRTTSFLPLPCYSAFGSCINRIKLLCLDKHCLSIVFGGFPLIQLFCLPKVDTFYPFWLWISVIQIRKQIRNSHLSCTLV